MIDDKSLFFNSSRKPKGILQFTQRHIASISFIAAASLFGKVSAKWKPGTFSNGIVIRRCIILTFKNKVEGSTINGFLLHFTKDSIIIIPSFPHRHYDFYYPNELSQDYLIKYDLCRYYGMHNFFYFYLNQCAYRKHYMGQYTKVILNMGVTNRRLLILCNYHLCTSILNRLPFEILKKCLPLK